MNLLKIFLITSILSIFLLVGCVTSQNTFSDYKEAKEALLAEENLNVENIIEELIMGEDYLILFEKLEEDKKVYAITNFLEIKDGNLKRDNTSSKISIEGTEKGRPVGTEYNTEDDRKITLTIGIYEESLFNELDENLKKGVLTVNKDRNIYYMVNIEK